MLTERCSSLLLLTTQLLFKGYQPKFHGRNQKDEDAEIDSETGLRWKRLWEHNRLPHSSSLAVCPCCHSPRSVKTHSLLLMSARALSYEPELVLEQISCMRLRLSLSITELCPHCCCVARHQPLQHAACHTFNTHNMRDVRSDERRKKISKMSSLMSNTDVSLHCVQPPPSGSAAAL